jgi:uncharacterized protein
MSIIDENRYVSYSTPVSSSSDSGSSQRNMGAIEEPVTPGDSDAVDLSTTSNQYMSGSLPQMQQSRYSQHLDSIYNAAGTVTGTPESSHNEDSSPQYAQGHAGNSFVTDMRDRAGEQWSNLQERKDELKDDFNRHPRVMDFAGNKDLAMEREELPVENLPKEWEGKKVVQLSDIHATEYNDREFFKKEFERVNAENPDIILFTGDYVSRELDHLDAFTEEAKKLKTTQGDAGKIAVLGNHDTGDLKHPYTEEERKAPPSEEEKHITKGLEDAGITVLNNENVQLGENEELNIVGLEDSLTRQPDIEKGFSGIDQENEASITLQHNPEYFSEIADANNSTVLAGHTHGSPYNLRGESEGTEPHPPGFNEENGSTMYVSRGMSGHKARWGESPEMTVFTLTSKEENS